MNRISPSLQLAPGEVHPARLDYSAIRVDLIGRRPVDFIHLPNPIAKLGPAQYKQLLRAAHHRCVTRGYDDAFESAMEFWRFYEQVNRDYCPDDPVYSVIRAGITPVAGSDYFTFITAASIQVRYLELIIGSEGTASAAARAVFQRSTGGTTGGGAQTPEEFNQLSPAASSWWSNIYTTWSAQPTLSGNPYMVFGWNALGGFVDWKAPPGAEIYQQGSSEQVSFRNAAGTAVVSVTAIIEGL